MKPALKAPAAPVGLSARSRKLWQKLHRDYVLFDEHRAVLAEALQSLDRAAAARRIIDAEGICLRDRFGQVVAHPALRVERDHRSLACRLIKSLGFTDDVAEPEYVDTLANRGRRGKQS